VPRGKKSRPPRMGALPPRYSFVLNPYPRERFTRCPQCDAKTRIRKIPLVIHFETVGLVMLRKSCRLCVVCETLIAHQAEVERSIDALGQTQASTREYLVLGTLDVKLWRRGLSGDVTVNELTAHMADFKHHMRIDYTPGGWYRSDEPAS
jgi:hypothetical protein